MDGANPNGNLVQVAVQEVPLVMLDQIVGDLLVMVLHFQHLLFLFICQPQIHIVQQ
jgi:hypothetical protein